MHYYTEFSSYADMKNFFSTSPAYLSKHIRRLKQKIAKHKHTIRKIRKREKIETAELQRLLVESERIYKEQGWHSVDPNANLSSIGMDYIEDVVTQGRMSAVS